MAKLDIVVALRLAGAMAEGAGMAATGKLYDQAAAEIESLRARVKALTPPEGCPDAPAPCNCINPITHDADM